MRTTPLGTTDIRVTELSFGAAAIGNLFRPVTDEAASGADNVVRLGTPPFPEAARAALTDTRLRANLPGHRHHPGPAAGGHR